MKYTDRSTEPPRLGARKSKRLHLRITLEGLIRGLSAL